MPGSLVASRTLKYSHAPMLTVDILNHKLSFRIKLVVPGDVCPVTGRRSFYVPDGLSIASW